MAFQDYSSIGYEVYFLFLIIFSILSLTFYFLRVSLKNKTDSISVQKAKKYDIICAVFLCLTFIMMIPLGLLNQRIYY